MPRNSESLVRNLARGAVLGMALVPVLVYIFTGYFGAKQMAFDDARVQASRANVVISANPDAWHYVVERFLDQIAEVRHQDTHTELTDLEGKMLAQIGEECLHLCVTAQAHVLDFGQSVGSLTVKINLVPILAWASFLGMLGLFVGLALVNLLNRHVLIPLERTRVANVELAFYDPLTRLPNRRLLMVRLDQALIASHRSQELGSVMILDLDHFKVINDTRGHDAGDRLLIEVAQRIRTNVREGDIVSRLGGDEYVVMVEQLGREETSAARQAEMIAEKIRCALNQPYVLSNSETAYHGTTSIGVVLFRGQQVSSDTLLKQADLALYRAKEAGRNAIRFFNPEMQSAIDSRAAMESALRQGLLQAEFQLYYQPQFDQTEKLIGAEALLRWFPANQAPIPPAQFIPLAEESGLIIPIGLWVMETACAQLKAWEHGPLSTLTVAINVSARQFRQTDFVDRVSEILQRTGANPAQLKLELTESMMLEHIEDVIAKMEAIQALGVKFSLDDFGTGFSSLFYLKRLPLRQIKIDQSFIRDITTDANDAAIVRAIIAMSQSLGLEVIAEGVETQAQRDFLRSCECAQYQGYFYGKPVPISEFARGLPCNALVDTFIPV